MLKLGFCITGSFCSMDDMLEVLRKLKKEYDIEIFITPDVNEMDTRFYSADTLKTKIKDIVDKEMNTSIQQAEEYGPLKKVDLVMIYPCDGKTLSKINNGINDNAVTMLVKSSLRNNVPVVLGVFSNDVLSNSGVNLFSLLNKKNFYFIPMYQDNYKMKPHSMIACKNKVNETIKYALKHEQYQPLMLGYREILD